MTKYPEVFDLSVPLDDPQTQGGPTKTRLSDNKRKKPFWCVLWPHWWLERSLRTSQTLPDICQSMRWPSNVIWRGGSREEWGYEVIPPIKHSIKRGRETRTERHGYLLRTAYCMCLPTRRLLGYQRVVSATLQSGKYHPLITRRRETIPH